MTSSFQTQLEKQLEEIVADAGKTRAGETRGDDIFNQQALLTRAIAAIRRGGISTPYAHEVARVLEAKTALSYQVRAVAGVAKAFLQDVKSGYLDTVTELVHADVAGDYLGQASELLDKRYKDAAAVMIGAILEQRLKNLADKHGTGSLKPDGSAKSANSLNDELAGAGVYNKTEQKTVLALLGLRNEAAHGNYGNYDEPQVKMMLAQVQHFLTLHPA